jgi:ribosomal protein S18 acetylase RimI-like enzyme
MKDIPVFTTEYGAASLVLKEIPYLQTAYITLQHSLEPEKLLQECVCFCRMCGAERIYATGDPVLESRRLYTAMWEMRCDQAALADTDAALFPVQEQTLSQWKEIYNQKVRHLPNGAWMSDAAAKAMLAKGDGYFIHRGEELLGIGRASDDTLDWVASVRPGAGRDVVCALAHALWCDTVKLIVASENQKALALYTALGFIRTKEISKWYIV